MEKDESSITWNLISFITVPNRRGIKTDPIVFITTTEFSTPLTVYVSDLSISSPGGNFVELNKRNLSFCVNLKYEFSL